MAGDKVPLGVFCQKVEDVAEKFVSDNAGKSRLDLFDEFLHLKLFVEVDFLGKLAVAEA